MTVAIPVGGFTISFGSDEKLASSVTLHVHFDVCPTWCKLALDHLATAMSCRIARVAAWEEANSDEKGKTLEREFEASMQATMASAIAIDAFYSAIQSHVQLPPSLVAKWREKRTPRYAQVSEVLRRAFHLKPNQTKALRGNLKEVYRFRDLAVHPTGKIAAPVRHPELQVGVEWRFAYFHAANAEALVNAAIAVIWELATKGKPTNDNIIAYTKGLRVRLTQSFPSDHPFFEGEHPLP